MGSFVNLSRPSLKNATVERPEKVRLPSGYTLLAFTSPDESRDVTVSVYPPGSDCVNKDEQVARFDIWREDVDVLLRMCAPPFPGKDGDDGA